MLARLKKYIPKSVFQAYHFGLAQASAILSRWPSKKLIVIGVTGTNGKSSTTQFIAQLLTELGATVGYTTTAGFSVAGKQIENRMKMTMPGRFYLQKLIAHMKNVGCEYAIIETSSQGIDQYRHLGINYDLVVFTNLTPEHIEAHGGFTPYKEAKGKLFAHLMQRSHKTIHGKRIPKVSVINSDDEHADYFAGFRADRHVSYSWEAEAGEGMISAKLVGREMNPSNPGVDVMVNGKATKLPLIAGFQHKNALAAIASVYGLGFALEDVLKAAKKMTPLAGRFESINQGQDFHVIVDYAYEPYAIEALLDSVEELQVKRVIGVHGSAGGGRDVGRRYKIGHLAAGREDLVIVTNEDPYDEDPRKIIEDVARGARDGGMVEGEDLFLIDDRQEAIDRAIAMAQPGDAVLLTAKGNEPVMAVAGGKKIPWSDKKAAQKALKKAGYAK